MTARGLWLAMAAATLAASTATAQPQTPDAPQHLISNPDWLRVPNGAELARLYPPAAAAQHVSGRTKAMCHVLADGALDACVVLEECPRGYGFGRATLSAAQDFQLRPKTVDGVPVEGGMVVVPMIWALEATTPPPACGAEPAPR
jgi:protein TonB